MGSKCTDVLKMEILIFDALPEPSTVLTVQYTVLPIFLQASKIQIFGTCTREIEG